MKKQNIICLVISIISILFVFSLWKLNLLHLWELKFYDYKFTIRGEREPSRDIVIVAIDEDSLSSENLGRWPWPRDVLARGIDNLSKAGVKAIGVDIIFPEPSRDRGIDRIYANSLKKADCVVGALYFEYAPVKVAKMVDDELLFEEEYHTKLVLPVSVLANSFKSLGFTNAYPDDDGVLRIAELARVYEGEEYFSFNSVISAVALDEEVESILPDFDEIFVNFRGGDKTYTRYSFAQIYKGTVPENWLKDKIILIGSTATGAFDHYPVPYEKIFPGVEFHANAIDNLINEDYMRACSYELIFIIIFLLSIILGQIFLKIKPWIAIILFILCIAIYFFLSQYLFVTQNFHIDFLKPTLSIIFCFSGVMSYRFATESREKRWIKKTFSYYLSPQVIGELTSDPDKLKLGGEKKVITILFSDIRGFTALAEKLQPEEVGSLLNEYLSAMTDVIFEYGGTLDKFIGDAIMVIWGAPIPQEDHVKRAVLCGIAMLEKLKGLQKEWTAQNKPLIEIGIGINSGEAIVGNMGSKQRMAYTAIGDNVNLASRIEALNKQYKTRMIISETTYKSVKDIVETKLLGKVKVKGKEKLTTIYKVLKKL